MAALTPRSTTGRPRMRSRLAALVEVTVAFALVHVTFRAVKRFSPLGDWDNQAHTNVSPGVVMVLVAILFITMRRKASSAPGDAPGSLAASFTTHALTPRPFFDSARAALVCLICFLVVGLAFLGCGAPISRPPMGHGAGITLASISLIATLTMLGVLARGAMLVARIPIALIVGILVAIPAAPVVIAAATAQPIGIQVLQVTTLVFAVGIGEEVFFRGYAQSRLNEAFGRPWKLFGVSFGPGLVLASAFFGLIHVLNPTDYFAGVYRFDWWHGLATLAALHYGFLRELTGSIAAPAMVHASSNVIVRLPALLAGP